jgi:N-acetylmuramoyl-L-alanine amidase
MTRKGDVFVPLEERTSIANDARADLFVSIHANATRDIGVRGIETFFLSLDASDEHARSVALRENESFGRSAAAKQADDPLVAIIGDLIATEHLEESNEFARLAQAELTQGQRHARGVKQAPFVVLEGVQMAASLIEIGFLTNIRDEARLASEQGRAQIVAGLVRATDEFGRRYDARRGVRRRASRTATELGRRGEIADAN